jgi:PilZ domain
MHGSERAKRGVVLNLMSANPIELFTAYVGLNKPTELDSVTRSERRRRARTKVHWPVLLFRNHSAEAVESTTQNLSSSGFYCMANVSFAAGEILTCTLKVPTHDPNGRNLERSLECKVRVMRVEPPAANGLFGVAFRIEDYHFAHM